MAADGHGDGAGDRREQRLAKGVVVVVHEALRRIARLELVVDAHPVVAPDGRVRQGARRPLKQHPLPVEGQRHLEGRTGGVGQAGRERRVEGVRGVDEAERRDVYEEFWNRGGEWV